MTSIAERKRQKRGRPRLEGDREANGRISRAKVERIEPTPEQTSKRALMGLQRNDALDCLPTRLYRDGTLTEQQRDGLVSIARIRSAYMAAICAPSAGRDSLAAFLPSRGGSGDGSRAIEAFKALEAKWSFMWGRVIFNEMLALASDNIRPKHMREVSHALSWHLTQG